MFFQGRGTLHVAKVVSGVPGPYRPICTDTFNIALATTPFSHINKCGPVDVEDFRGVKDQSGTINLTFADVEDRNLALGVLGTITPAMSIAGTVSGEELPTDIGVGDVYFLGGLTRHRNITSLVLTGLVLTTDYTLDAATGKVTFVTAQAGSPVIDASYGFTDPQSVGMFTAPSDEYSLMYEFINKGNSNKKGSLELYRVRFDPISNLDMQSDSEQVMDIKGSVLADLTKPVDDTEFGQFGRRVL